jgi:hypothetical protein
MAAALICVPPLGPLTASPQYLPGRASLVPYWGGAEFGRGRECWEDLKKLLFVLRSSASPGDRALVPCGLWARFFQLNRSALAPTPK